MTLFFSIATELQSVSAELCGDGRFFPHNATLGLYYKSDVYFTCSLYQIG